MTRLLLRRGTAVIGVPKAGYEKNKPRIEPLQNDFPGEHGIMEQSAHSGHTKSGMTALPDADRRICVKTESGLSSR